MQFLIWLSPCLFQIAAKTKAKETKALSKENADPNVQKAPKPKKAKATKAKGEGKVYKFYTVFLNVGFTLKQLPRILLVHFSNYKGICKCIKLNLKWGRRTEMLFSLFVT